ncbi:MAG: type I restriction endonuclease subunit R [Hydrotalea sp. AMD]|uniref:type I restriction endonuclease subunit R n=1 Tax=Hydrotalea TaxID=1004300 RepID=UPI0009440311|nr:MULTISPECIES: type I restriction endonuclease subunit R [Hydrotalea]RWZ85875.1 MAG: type I restriction endonuclease subunit R [Hydrotalea sp. AMD]
MSKPITENIIEQSAIEILQSQGWEYANGKEISPEGLFCERENFSQIVLINRLRTAIAKINPTIPLDAQEAAVQKVLRIASPDLLHNNEEFHRLLVEKVKIPYQENGYERSHEVALIDFEHPANNQFLVVNQYTIIENNQNKRPDVLLFVNGLPLVVVELKNAASENADIKSAYQQIQTYKSIIPSLFTYNAICILSDGLECKAGSVSADLSRYMTWKTADGIKEASRFKPQLETLLKGMLQPATLLDLVRNFIVFEKSKKEDAKTGLIQIQTVKKLAAYHQFFAVNKAVQSTVNASGENGDKRGGVVWHTQGSGKSLSMVFYSGKLITSPEMKNPTIVVITDRNDLDDQLFDTFASSVQLLRQEPVQAENREHLKELLKVASGGIVFTTIQKFLPENNKSVYDQLSDRKNVVVIADEAHRTQYGFEAKLVDEKDKETKEVIGKRIAYGFAKYMRDALPNATYIGFTGTPIEGTDVNTPQVFGNYIDRYDIKDAVDDGATVKIFYESRLAKVNLDEEGRRLIEEFDKELEQDEELTEKQKAKAKWTKLEAIVGHHDRVKNLAKDIVTHFEKRQTVFEGKAMIVAMSRRIAADLYKEIIALRPDWHNDDLTKGAIKVVMTTNSADGPEFSKHHTTKQQRRDLSERMKDPADELKLVIVRDMWLTGFDAPCLNTMYVDKPMRGHNLMQAIARVNRVFKDKPGGLIVDYLGIGTDLKKALSFYGEAGGKGDPAENIEKAFEIFKEKLEVVQQMFNEDSITRNDILVEEPEAYYEGSFKFNYRRFFVVDAQEKLSIILQAEEHILGLQDGKERFIREVSLLSQALSLCITKEEVQPHLPEVAFFQAMKARLAKFDAPIGGGKSDVEIETAIKQIVDEALSSDKVIDIFDAAGIDKPEISGLEILSDEFLLEVQGMQHKNLAIELLKKILNNELKVRAKTNLVKSKKLLEMLEGAIKRYQNNLLTTAEIIQELINIAKQIKEADKEGEKLGLNNDEVAFYNALEINDSAVQVLGDDTLKEIAREIADKVRANATIDWTIRESARAKLMVLVRRTLNKYGYPPDKQQKAIDTVLKQAELLADNLTA